MVTLCPNLSGDRGMEGIVENPVKARFLVLKAEHRELDESIALLQESAYVDQIQLQRLKKRKLQLKDEIEKLRCSLIPDLDA